jgi:uncharacterized membrane protein YfcA
LLLADAAGLTIIALLVGIISSMIGVGGGFLMVPTLTLLYSIITQQAVGTSSAVIVVNAIASTFAYYRQKRIDYKVGATLAVGTVPGAMVGAYLTKLISAGLLAALFGAFLVFVALRMLLIRERRVAVSDPGTGVFKWHRVLTDASGARFDFFVSIPVGLGTSFFGGLASGLFGIGGGAIMVPVMNLVMGMPMHVSVATSMFMMIFTSVSGALTHVALNNVLPEYAAALSLGIVGGSQIGASIARRLRPAMLQRIFSLFLIFIGVRMIWPYFVH